MMQQILQNLRSGELTVANVPAPTCRSGHLLIATRRSLVSAGTERMLVEFAQANLVQKALAQPERVRQVMDKIRTDGVLPTMEAVFAKLDEPLPLGYCNAGVVIEVGAGVEGFTVGDRVVSNGPHAEIVSVSKNLCARIPDDVHDDSAAFTVLASIGLEGIRLAAPTLGERIVVIGLGLIGLLTVQMLLANGCHVLGIDFDEKKLAIARQYGAETVNLTVGVDPVAAGMTFSQGRGVDAVLVTASSKSDDIIHQAAQMSRKRGRIILVGVVGLSLARADFYEKELTFQVSCSYGPGRYDETYEQGGSDYPFGFVRWTEQRNFEAVLGLMLSGRLDLSDLISTRVAQRDAPSAYKLLTDSPATLGIVLTYPTDIIELKHTLSLGATASSGIVTASIGMVGVGNFGSRILLPALVNTDAKLTTVASSGGTSAAIAAKKFHFAQATSDYKTILADPNVNTLVIATRHDSHARMVVEALCAGKHVFVEKPLALNRDQLDQIEITLRAEPQLQLMVGYNRRFAPLAISLHDALRGRSQPCSIIYTVNAGDIPAKHWTQSAEVGGGRIIGEACHFIDLLRYLIGSPIVGVEARMLGNAPGMTIRQDKMMILLDFADGSTGVVHYLANGSKSFPKEQIEVFSEGRIAVLDNFKSLRGYGWSNLKGVRSFRQDKGHNAEIAAFIDRVKNGGALLIPWPELKEVSLATFAAIERAAEPARPLTETTAL